MIRAVGLWMAVAAASVGGCRKASVGAPAEVAASNSLLECAARDLLGDSTPILRLAEPGMCPGHFDIRPSQAEQIRRCRVLLRLDFQKSLDAQTGGAKGAGPQIAEIRIAGGLCEPESYLAACRQTADALVAAGLLDRLVADRRLGEIDRRIEQAASQCLTNVQGLKDTPVIASVHQKSFCQWLGLRVVGTFSGADTAAVTSIDRAVRDGEAAGVKVVIANRPEGRRVADALAERLQAKVVVFGNFPALDAGQASFEDLLAGNVEALRKAAGS